LAAGLTWEFFIRKLLVTRENGFYLGICST